MTRPWKRRVFLINADFQIKVVAFFGAISAVTILVFLAANRYFFWKFEEKGMALGLPSDHVFFKFIEEQKQTMTLLTFGMAWAMLAFLITSGIYLSNRVAGPIFRLTQHMNRIADGEAPTEVAFRKKDFFPELAEACNRAIKKLAGGR